MAVLGIVGLVFLSGRWPLLRLGWGTSMTVATLVAALSPTLVFEKSYDLGPRDMTEMEFTAPPRPQQLRVTVTAKHPVGAWLVRTTDAEAARQALDAGKTPKATLAGKAGSAKIALKATVPAGVGYTLLVKNSGRKDVKVRVRVAGR